MIQTVSEEAKDNIVGNIAAPAGWEISERIVDPSNIEEQKTAAVLKKKIGVQFPFIAESVESYINKVFDKMSILISNAFISISEDATFQILLLVNKEDYFSPKLYAAKIDADEDLTSMNNMSMQYRFASEGEYFKSYHARHSDKLRYSFRNPLAMEA